MRKAVSTENRSEPEAIARAARADSRAGLAEPPRPVPAAVWAAPPIVASLVSALLFWLSFPPADRGYLGWVALVPLFLLVARPKLARRSYLAIWLGGLLFWLLAIEWIRRIDDSAWLAWIVMATYLSLYWPVFVLLARRLLQTTRLPLLVVAPVCWVALEYAQSLILTGFPWFYLSQTQYRVLPVIQIADITGIWGVSLLVAAVNACLAGWLHDLERPREAGGGVPRRLLRQSALVLGAVVLVVAYGGFRLAGAAFRPGPRIALLQSDFVQALKMSLDGERILEAYHQLIVRALPARPDLIVWPETSFPYYQTNIAPGLDDRALERLARSSEPNVDAPEIRRRQQIVSRMLHELADSVGVPVVYGLGVFDYGPAGRTKTNAALLVEPRVAGEQRYDKLHLVPFGEYVPLLQTFPFLTRLTPYHGDQVPNLAPGQGPVQFEAGGLRYANAICFEDTVPRVVRRSFAGNPDGRPPDVLLNISNDGWFHGSSELDMHLAVSVFRAIENRVPIARAVNTGISAVIDGNGRIRARLPKNQAAPLVASIPLDDRTSLYPILGDWLAQLCSIAAIALIILSFLPARFLPRAIRLPA